jgi:hypothetical protein
MDYCKFSREEGRGQWEKKEGSQGRKKGRRGEAWHRWGSLIRL